MCISLTGFVSDLQRYFTDHPSAARDEAYRSLTALAERSFENAEEAELTLSEFVQTVQESNNEELKAVVQHLFDQAIQRLLSASSTETETSIQNLGQDYLTHIFSFLHLKDQGQAGAVCRTWREALRCRQRWDLADDPKVTQLLSSFGMSFPPQDASLKEHKAAWNDIFAKVAIILNGIHGSEVLSDEEKKPFFEKTSQEIVNDPNLWQRLLHTAYELSLVAPFLNGKNHGPKLSRSMTLAEKAEAIRSHLKERGGTYTKLDCDERGMLCFPIEFCSLQNLQRLNVSNNQITFLPQEIGQLVGLQRLDADNNHLAALPPQIGLLVKLQVLSAFDNQIAALPPQIGLLTALQRLFLSNNQIAALPPQIGQLAALQGLYVGNNQITSLPPQIGKLAKLQYLLAFKNQITALPPQITDFTQNIYIDLTNNPLTTIPKFPKNIDAHL